MWGGGDPPLTPPRRGILRKIWQWRSDGTFFYTELSRFDIKPITAKIIIILELFLELKILLF